MSFTKIPISAWLLLVAAVIAFISLYLEHSHTAPELAELEELGKLESMAGSLRNVVVVGGSFVGLVSWNLHNMPLFQVANLIRPCLQNTAKELASLLPATHRVSSVAEPTAVIDNIV